MYTEGDLRRHITLIQISILPEYQGPKLKDVPVVSTLFKGMKFSVFLQWVTASLILNLSSSGYV